jgi:hypothetical protein
MLSGEEEERKEEEEEYLAFLDQVRCTLLKITSRQRNFLSQLNYPFNLTFSLIQPSPAQCSLKQHKNSTVLTLIYVLVLLLGRRVVATRRNATLSHLEKIWIQRKH